MLKLIIKAEEITKPDGTKDLAMEVYTDPPTQEPHVTQVEMNGIRRVKQAVTEAIAKAGGLEISFAAHSE